MDVAAWLRGLGLEQYAPAFRDNAVDGEVLRELTADDLKDLGATLVGHRRKLLAPIAALGRSPQRVMWLNQGRVRHLLQPPIPPSTPNVGS
jgi:hypothetical protein